MALFILYWALIALMVVGLVGAFVPALPGIGLIVAAVLIWSLATGFASTSWALGTAIVALVLSLGVNYLATYLGAKKVGASKWGQIGSVVGLVVGFLGLLPALPVGGPLLGVLFGTMAGAFLGEFLYRKELGMGDRLKFSGKVSLAVVVSSLIGTLLEGLLALTAVIVFIATTWSTVSFPEVSFAGLHLPSLNFSAFQWPSISLADVHLSSFGIADNIFSAAPDFVSALIATLITAMGNGTSIG
ncbi:MAG: DUF456 family protein [Cyanobacteria bacterium J06598_3]